MIILGCDPGLTGALSAIQPGRGLLAVADLPTCSNGLETGSMKRWLDCTALRAQLIDWSAKFDFAREDVRAVIERPIAMPSLPAQTIASQFDTFGAIRAVLERTCSVQVVAPNEWKKLFGFGKDKNGARQACLSLYPEAPVSRVKDHNRAEAILIGHWGVRKIHG
jgi:hypothetical protein